MPHGTRTLYVALVVAVFWTGAALGLRAGENGPPAEGGARAGLGEEERRDLLALWYDDRLATLRDEGWSEVVSRDEVERCHHRLLHALDPIRAALRSTDMTIVDMTSTNLGSRGEVGSGAPPRMEVSVHRVDAVYDPGISTSPTRYIKASRALLTPWNTEPHELAPDRLVGAERDASFFHWAVHDGRSRWEWQFPGNFGTGTLRLEDQEFHQVADWRHVPMAPTDALIAHPPRTPAHPGWDVVERQEKGTLHPLTWLGAALPTHLFPAQLLADRLGLPDRTGGPRPTAPPVRLALLERGAGRRIVAITRSLGLGTETGADLTFGVSEYLIDGPTGLVREFQMAAVRPDEVTMTLHALDVAEVRDAEGRSIPVVTREVTSTLAPLGRSVALAFPPEARLPLSERLHDREVHFVYHVLNEGGIERPERFTPSALAERVGVRVALGRERPMPPGEEEAVLRDTVRYSREFVVLYDDATMIVGPPRCDFSWLVRADEENRLLFATLHLPIQPDTIIPYASLTHLYTRDAVDTTVFWQERIPDYYQEGLARAALAQEEAAALR